MRQLIATLVLVNLLFFAWNYTFPYVNPLVDDYIPAESVTELRLVSPSATAPAAGSGEGDSEAPAPAPESEEPVSVAPTPARAPVVRAPAEEPVFVCGSIGPMLNAEEQTSVLSILSLETRAELSVRVDRNKRDLSYWVMIPPLESLAEARSYMRVLAEGSMNESFIVTEEENRNAISLGVFRDKSKAQRLLDRTAELPLETKPEMVVRGSHDYWVDFKSEVSNDYYRTVGTLLKQKKHLQHTETTCPD